MSLRNERWSDFLSTTSPTPSPLGETVHQSDYVTLGILQAKKRMIVAPASKCINLKWIPPTSNIAEIVMQNEISIPRKTQIHVSQHYGNYNDVIVQ